MIPIYASSVFVSVTEHNSRLLIYALFALLIIVALCWISSKIKYVKYRRSIAKAEAEKKDSSKRRYITRKMKDYVLERDDYTCQICGMSKAFLDSFAEGLGDYLLLEIDHIESVKQGGSGADEGNLQVLCWRCNRKKSGTKTNEDVYAAIDYGIDYFLAKPKRKLWTRTR